MYARLTDDAFGAFYDGWRHAMRIIPCVSASTVYVYDAQIHVS